MFLESKFVLLFCFELDEYVSVPLVMVCPLIIFVLLLDMIGGSFIPLAATKPGGQSTATSRGPCDWTSTRTAALGSGMVFFGGVLLGTEELRLLRVCIKFLSNQQAALPPW